MEEYPLFVGECQDCGYELYNGDYGIITDAYELYCGEQCFSDSQGAKVVEDYSTRVNCAYCGEELDSKTMEFYHCESDSNYYCDCLCHAGFYNLSAECLNAEEL